MSIGNFSQRIFVEGVFAFIKKHKIKHRDFLKHAGLSSLETLYATRNGTREIKLSTIAKLEKAMETWIVK